jgi:hypothetical protein
MPFDHSCSEEIILLKSKDMKKFFITSVLAILVAASTSVMAQHQPEEYLGLPGDNLNLYAVMKLFQESETLEGFERNLNDENSRINNLDLNGDNLVDYIMVIDYADGDFHHIVLRVAVEHEDYQDVAVFTVQRYSDGSAGIQLIGDHALYGPDYIIEPYYADHGSATPNPGYIGRTRSASDITVVRTTTVGIAAWPVIRFIFRPDYIAWHSSYYWGYYPSYWSPWRPYYWHYYYGYHYNWHSHYYTYYRTWNHHRYTHYNNYYYGNIRRLSPRVNDRIVQGKYNSTYSRPELRREGEALYSRTSRQQSRDLQQNTSRSSTGRGTVTSTNRSITRESAVRDSDRRPAPSTRASSVTKNTGRETSGVKERTPVNQNTRSINRSSSQQQTGAVRQGSLPSQSRTATRPADTGRNVSSGRSATTAKTPDSKNQATIQRGTASNEQRPAYSGRAATNSSVSQKSGISNRQTSTGRVDSRPASSTRVSNQGSSSRQASPGVRQGNSSSNSTSRSVSKSTSDSNSNRSDSGRPSRR